MTKIMNAKHSHKSKLIYCAFGEDRVIGSQPQDRIAKISCMRAGEVTTKLLNERMYMMARDTFEYIACSD